MRSVGRGPADVVVRTRRAVGRRGDAARAVDDVVPAAVVRRAAIVPSSFGSRPVPPMNRLDGRFDVWVGRPGRVSRFDA
jgi:hypothetical protein